MGLYVGPFGSENFFQPVYGELLRLVYHFATSIVTFPGITLGIFVGQARTHGLHDLVADKIFRSDKFDPLHLALAFAFDDVENGVVSLHCFVIINFKFGEFLRSGKDNLFLWVITYGWGKIVLIFS